LSGLWQIFVRQGSIADADSDATLADVLTPFGKIQNDRDVFDGGRSGIRLLLKATHSPEKIPPQDRMIDLLAGTATQDPSDAHQQVVEDMIRIFEAQKLVSLTTLFDLADNLESVARGEKLNTALAGKLASRTAGGVYRPYGRPARRIEAGSRSLEHFNNYCRLAMESLNHALAFSAVTSCRASVIA